MHFKNLLFIIILAGLVSCKHHKHNIKFDKAKWAIKNDTDFPYRNKMLKDLTTNYKLVGLKQNQLLSLLGEPNYSDPSSVAYKVVEDYGFYLEPVFTKKLDFVFNKDSVITAVKIIKLKK